MPRRLWRSGEDEMELLLELTSPDHAAAVGSDPQPPDVIKLHIRYEGVDQATRAGASLVQVLEGIEVRRCFPAG
jgi:hypothetical protein